MVGSRQYALVEPEVAGEQGLDRLQGEVVALQSILYGLCVALSQVSELQREVVIQACDYARRTPEAQALNRGDGSQASAEAFNGVVAQLRAAIMDRYRSF